MNSTPFPVLQTSHSSIAQAAEHYREHKLRAAFIAHPKGQLSPAGTLKSAIAEHKGRWLYEILQNADDAQAPTCNFHLENGVLTISDDGNGIPSEAVDALSLPNISHDKEDGSSIGRKGIGFCSVYEITDSPSIYSKGSGLIFSKDQTENWLRGVQHQINEPFILDETLGKYPYLHSIIPFGISELPYPPKYHTIQNLDTGTSLQFPLRSGVTEEHILSSFDTIDSRFLLTFKWLKSITFFIDGVRTFYIGKSKIGNSSNDSNAFRLLTVNTQQKLTRDRYLVWSKRLPTPEEVLTNSTSSSDDKKRLSSVSTSIIAKCTSSLALQHKENSRKSSTNRLFTYYPTDEELPLVALIHGDFLLDNSRKHLADKSENSFNYWLLQQSISLLIDTANRLIQNGDLASASSLFQLEDFQEHKKPQIEQLEKIIPNFRESVSQNLLIPDTSGSYSPLANCLFIELECPEREAAIHLLTLYYPDKKIAAPELCSKASKKTILPFISESYWLNQSTILKLLEKSYPSQNPQQIINWGKATWTWISRTAQDPEFKNRPFDFSKLKIIPTETSTLSTEKKNILPCLIEDSSVLSGLPSWLNIHALPADFSHWVSVNKSNLAPLISGLAIQSFSEASVVKAFARLIKTSDYIEASSDIYREYLDFAISRGWPDHPALDQFQWKNFSLKNLCIPIVVSSNEEPSTAKSWSAVAEAYLGGDWGNPDLDLVLPENSDYPRVDPQLQKNHDKVKEFLQLCGACESPQLISPSHSHRKFEQAFWDDITEQIPDTHVGNKNNAQGSNLTKLLQFRTLNTPAIQSFNQEEASALLRLLFKHWRSTYSESATLQTRHSKNNRLYSCDADNIWVRELKLLLLAPSAYPTQKALIPTPPLGLLWIQTSESPKWAKALFPILNTGSLDLSNDQIDSFKQWIIDTPLVKSQAKHIKLGDWTSTIFPALEEFIRSPHGELKNQIQITTQFYRAILDSSSKIKSRAAAPRAALFNNELTLIPIDKPIWAATNKAQIDLWQQHVPVFLFRDTDLSSATVETLNLRNLEKEIQEHIVEIENQPQEQDCSTTLQSHAAWIYAYRSHEVKELQSIERWKATKLIIKNSVIVHKSVESISIKSEEPFFYDKLANTLFITRYAYDQYEVFAAALVKCFMLPEGDTDRIENLLRISNEERITRLTSKDLSLYDYENAIAEYNGLEATTFTPAPPTQPQEPEITVAIEEAEQDTRTHKRQLDPPSNPPRTPSPNTPANDDTILHPLGGGADFPVELITEPAARQPRVQVDTGYTERARGANSQFPADAPQTETRSRGFVIQKLEALGYKVEQKPPNWKGFDLLAIRGDQKIRIEVKGSKGPANEITLTHSELEIAQPTDEYTWQLWHVSKLDSTSGERPTIRVYSEILKESLRVPSYSVDLSQLHQITPK